MKLTKLRRYISRNPFTVLLGIGILIFIIRAHLVQEPLKPAPAPLPKVTVKEKEAKPLVINIHLNGHTAEARQVTLKAKTWGRIIGVPAIKGQHVEAGQDLILIDAEDRPARLEEAKSKVHQRELEFQAGTKLEAKAFKAQNAQAASKAELNGAKSLLITIEQEIADTHIKAPFKGIFEETFVEVGDLVHDGDKVATVIELNPLRIICHISEKDVSRVQLKEKAEVILGVLQDKTLQAEVIYIAKIADPKTRTYRVEMIADNPDLSIPAGLTARIIFTAGKTTGYFISPAAISLRDDGTIGIKTVEEGKVVFHAIHVVEAKPEGLLVTGLPDKITLITNGGDFVVEGQAVTSFVEPGDPAEHLS